MEETINQDKSKTQEEFIRLLAQDLSGRKLVEGSIIKAKVTLITKKYVVCDIAGKSEAQIPIQEFQFSKELDQLKINDVIEVMLDTLENKQGLVVVSRERAKRELSWKKMLVAFEKKNEVEGVIVGRVRGGFCVDTQGSLCFLPQSQVDTKIRNNFDDLYKIPHKYEIVKVDTRRKNIVLSRKSIIEKKRNIDRDKIISKMKEGQILDGIVKNITSFGAFIDLQGVDSLLHINEISFSRIERPSDILSIGQTIRVKIIKIDESNKISVSCKALTDDPYIKEIGKYKKGEKYLCQITKITDYGAFARLGDDAGLEGLIHQSQCHHTKKTIHPSKVFSTTQKVMCEILEIDTVKRRISLSYKNCIPNPWDEFAKNYKEGDKCFGTVKGITDYAIFLSIKDHPELDAMCHYKNISWSEKESELKKYKKGMPNIEFKILELSREKEKIRAGIRELKSDDPFAFYETKAVGDIVTVICESTNKNGILVYAGSKDLLILIKRNQLARETQNCRISRFVPKQKIDCCIQDLNKDDRSVSLSIKMMEERDAKESIKKFGSTSSGAVLGDILGRALNLKKKKKSED